MKRCLSLGLAIFALLVFSAPVVKAHEKPVFTFTAIPDQDETTPAGTVWQGGHLS